MTFSPAARSSWQNVGHARRVRILDAIERLTATHGFPPTVREIGEATGTRSSSLVHHHLAVLERDGLITRDPIKSRTIRLTTDRKA